MIDYGYHDIEEFITEYRESKGMDVRVALTELGESHFDIDKFEKSYEDIKSCGFYIVELTQRYPIFDRWIKNKYNIKDDIEKPKELEAKMEDKNVDELYGGYNQYTEWDVESFIGMMQSKYQYLMETMDEEDKLDLSEFDFLDNFIFDWKEHGLDSYFPLTIKYKVFADYMSAVYGDKEE